MLHIFAHTNFDNLISGLKSGIDNEDGMEIASSVLGLVSTVGAFFPPYGVALAAVAGKLILVTVES